MCDGNNPVADNQIITLLPDLHWTDRLKATSPRDKKDYTLASAIDY